jgi:hypothetical protein
MSDTRDRVAGCQQQVSRRFGRGPDRHHPEDNCFDRIAAMPACDAIDLIDELRLRRWARENYVAGEDRDDEWHPIILDEMIRRDAEGALADEPIIFPSSLSYTRRLDGMFGATTASPHFQLAGDREPMLATREMHYF